MAFHSLAGPFCIGPELGDDVTVRVNRAAATVAAALTVGGLTLATLASPAGATTAARPAYGGGGGSPALPLGPRDLPQTTTSQQVAPGVTLTTITRGFQSPSDYYTVNIGLPTTLVPGATTEMVGTQAVAQQEQAQLTADGFTGSVIEPADNPGFIDYPASVLGAQLRIGDFATAAAAAPLVAQLAADGFATSVTYTGQDGGPDDGPWVIRELTVDFREFRGQVEESHDASIVGRRWTTLIGDDAGAIAAVNGGYFNETAAEGVVGDDAGIIVEHGQLEHDATDGRAAAVLGAGGRDLRIEDLSTWIFLTGSGVRHRIEGLNREPGLIRDCGGDDPGDQPTALPLMNITCTNPNELVAFTPQFGSPLPAGPGSEAVLNAQGQATYVGPQTQTSVPAGGEVLEGIGTEATWLTANVTVGDTYHVRDIVTDGRRIVRFGPDDSAVNGGPQLVRNGQVFDDVLADGLVQPNNPTAFFDFAVRRNPRTLIGVNRDGDLMLVEVDGDTPASVGLSLPESADLMQALGAVQAMNMDGGGSSTMEIDGQMINSPTDPPSATEPDGQRQVGDAVVVVPAASSGPR
jgi:exopolysaccharide biosynthesis protein